jgi:hypothetical protein
MADIAKYQASKYKQDLKEVVMACGALRSNPQNPVDISLSEFARSKWGVSMEALYDDLGLNASVDTISNIFTMPDESVRWLVPEIIRDAVRLGLRKNPIWADLIASEQTIANPTTTIPHWNMSDALPRYVGEGETISKGSVSFGQKTLKIRKLGKGLRISYEVAQYVTINILSIFLQDFGVQLNLGIDSLLIDTLINGEQADLSESAPVVGIGTSGLANLTYRDLLTVWIRMARIGRTPYGIIGGEAAALQVLNLAEFKQGVVGGTNAAGVAPNNKLDLKTPIPNSSAYYIHGSVPANQQIIIDRSSALIKYNSQPLLVENDKIVSNQTLETYVSLTTGFGILYRDARVVLDAAQTIIAAPFPTYMDVDARENVDFV